MKHGKLLVTEKPQSQMNDHYVLLNTYELLNH